MDNGPIRICISKRHRATPHQEQRTRVHGQKNSHDNVFVSTEYMRKKVDMKIYNETKQITNCQIMCHEFLFVKFTPAQLLPTSCGKKKNFMYLLTAASNSFLF